MTEFAIQDQILKLAMDLQRYSAHSESEVVKLIAELEAELRRMLQTQTLTEVSRRKINEIIDEAKAVISASYGQASDVVDMHRIAIIVADKTQAALADILPELIKLPTAETLASLTRAVLIEGAPTRELWARRGRVLGEKFADQVRQGVANGETNEQIVRRVVGGWRKDQDGIRYYQPGLFGRAVSRNGKAVESIGVREARTLVHSSIMSAANNARLAVFRKNPGMFKGVRWLSTLDSHTCKTCAALDGQAWDLEGNRLPGTTKDFQLPPAPHPNCRCVASGIPRPTSEMLDGLTQAQRDKLDAIDRKYAATSERVSSTGTQKGSMTFAEWFKTLSPKAQDDMFGPKRANLIRSGEYTISDMVTQNGRPLTLEELAAR